METITIELRYSTAEMNKLFLGKKEDASAVWYATSNKRDEYLNVPIPTPYMEGMSKTEVIKRIQSLNPNALVK